MATKKSTILKFTRINNKAISNLHVFADIAALAICHVLFLLKYKLPYHEIFNPLLTNKPNILASSISITIIIATWLFAFYLSGHYSNTARKSGMQIIGPTLSTCVIISVLIFFILTNCSIINLKDNILQLTLRYFFVVFGLVFSFRMIIISRLHYLINSKGYGYKTILIGNNTQVLDIVKKSHKSPYNFKNHFAGYIAEDKKNIQNINKYIPYLGHISDFEKIITEVDVDEAIISLQLEKHETINNIINTLIQRKILIKLYTNLNAILKGTLKTQNLDSLPFITISHSKSPVWQQAFKRFFDFIMAWFGLIICTPIFILASVGIKLSSKGPIFYAQERIGRNHKPFMIYKFRSMYIDAEKDGPALSSINDPRITNFGHFLRKWRFDELPQFINIILGDMSFVGPRPERKYFIDQILPLAPHYKQLFAVRPGITSWGMVQYGYAENIEQMIDRLQYDILYLENRTLVVDFKIMLYTLKTIFSGEGK